MLFVFLDYNMYLNIIDALCYNRRLFYELEVNAFYCVVSDI